MFNKKIKFLLLALTCYAFASGQNCDLRIEGIVVDEATREPLSFVNVLIQENSRGQSTDSEGKFIFENICANEFHLIFSHIGCASKKIHLDLEGDTSLVIELPHTSTALGVIVVKGQNAQSDHHPHVSINRQEIDDNTNKSVAGLIQNEAGVGLIENGSGIAKPVVHGLYGNRVLILNNGIVQSGQQWGNDHSPEIDPFSADKITVLKGASALEYSGGNLGSAILVEPKRIEREPHLHGQLNYAFESNGRGHNFNTRLGKYNPVLPWRLSASIKKYGDRETPVYYLNNTGTEEINLATQLEKSWNDKIYLDVYASTFNTRIGILRGSHVSSLPALEEAIQREIPFFTESEFSYGIDAPKQEVSHHLIKARSRILLEKDQTMDLIMAGQWNKRKEFDIRRSGRSDIPALDLDQFTLNAEFKYTKRISSSLKIKSGIQNIITDNTNNPETGILPLIPDYLTWKSGSYGTISKSLESIQINMGLRYDYEFQSVAAISQGVPKTIERYANNFHNITGLLGLNFDISNLQSISFNSGWAVRNPAINELYSNGLHQGVSGIEEGDINLKAERALKNILEYRWVAGPDFSLNVLAFHQYFDGYIYLKPQDEIRSTIRGAFPVFAYDQTNATIYGVDFSTQFSMIGAITGELKYSFLRGHDITNDVPLVFMPPNNLFASITYRLRKSFRFSSKLSLEESEIEVNNKYIFEQDHLLADQDYLAPPPAYNLLGFKISTNLVLPNFSLRFFVKLENALNQDYRSYLNRQRYFADDTGLSVTTGVSIKF